MKTIKFGLGAATFSLVLVLGLPLQAQELSGFLKAEGVVYGEDSDFAPAHSFALSAEVRGDFALSDAWNFSFQAFGRYDPESSERSYVDLPVAKLSYTNENFEFGVGFDTVFWGVAESQRIVNIVNQPDFIRSLRADITQGQPMVYASWLGDVWSLEGYVLPYFRERRFGGDDYRNGMPLRVDTSQTQFESADGKWNTDVAGRLSGKFDNFEFGLSAFQGTLREPTFGLNAANLTLFPIYQLGTQIGLDAQYTFDATLLKFEGKAVYPRNKDHYFAGVYGIEHGIDNLLGTSYEAALFLEHNFDSRGVSSTSIYQNDLFAGLRVNFGDTAGTALFLGGYYDLDHGSTIGRVSFETRLSDNLRFEVEGYVFDADKPEDSLYDARGLDQLTIGLKLTF